LSSPAVRPTTVVTDACHREAQGSRSSLEAVARSAEISSVMYSSTVTARQIADSALPAVGKFSMAERRRTASSGAVSRSLSFLHQPRPRPHQRQEPSGRSDSAGQAWAGMG